MTKLRAVAALLLLAAPVFAADVYLGVEGARSSAKRTVGLPPFIPENPQRREDAEIGAKSRDVLRSDLLFSRYFDVVEGENLPVEGAAAMDAWRTAGAALLLSAKSAQVQDIVTLSVKLSETAKGDAMLERYYRQNARFWRTLAHKVSDDVTRQLTGRPGIAHTQIAFVNDQTGAKELYLADYDGENVRRATSYKSITMFPRFSPDGKQIAFTSYKDGNPDLYLYAIEKGSVRTASERQGLNIAGGFSPDGTKLALTMSAQKNPNIYILTLADGSTKRVTSHFGVDSSPTFSPDGQQIAFVSDRAGNPQIHVQEISTGRVRRLTHLNWCDSPSWSPSGEWIAFAGRANSKDKMDIFLVDVTGGRLIQLIHGEGSNEEPSWAPDSRFLAFMSTRGGRKQVFLMDADGSTPHPLADIPGNSSEPNWGP